MIVMRNLERGSLHLSLALLALTLTACDIGRLVGFTGGSKDLPENQVYVFEVEYVNYAWVPTYSGFFIGSDGALYRFDRQGEPWEESSSGSETEARLADKYSSAERIRVVGLPENASTLIRRASRGRLLDPVYGCADFGTITYRAYRYSNSSQRYDPILLYRAGDVARENESAAATTLHRWLRNIPEIPNPEDCLP